MKIPAKRDLDGDRTQNHVYVPTDSIPLPWGKGKGKYAEGKFGA